MLLIERSAIQLKIYPSVNPNTFLPEEEKETEQIVLQIYAAREDLKAMPLKLQI